MKIQSLSCLILIAMVPTVNAQPWQVETAAGALLTSGNSENTTYNAKLDLSYQVAPWTHAVYATALGAASEDNETGADNTTAERYTAGYQATFDLRETDYLFAALDYEKDRFAGVRERTTQTLGYGHELLRNESHRLTAEVGAGARQLTFQDDEEANEFIGRAGIDYTWTITPHSRFLQTLRVESGSSNTFTESVSELKLAIIGNLSARLSFTLRNNSDVPENTERTDTETAFNLAYAFGKQST